MEEWATLQELSHAGSNRNADRDHFCEYPAMCDRGWQVVECECRQKEGVSSSEHGHAVESTVH